MHIGGFNGYATTGSGTPSYYYEEHHAIVQTMQSCMMSFILEGALEEFPDLKIVLIEGGFAWAPALAWRMDKHWERMRNEVPHVKRPPSEYVRQHVWFTTQPIDEPDNPQHLVEVIEWLGWDRLMFSTDYPHWDFDDPLHSFKFTMTEAQKALVYRDNARTLYGLS
jgi:predicted TIM-barrel fold metal-dependent hydrolase